MLGGARSGTPSTSIRRTHARGDRGASRSWTRWRSCSRPRRGGGGRYDRHDFTADGTTSVSFKGQPKGSIAGADLQHALLKIWLGAKPVQSDVKAELLKG
jgi:hypothetical protein